MVENRRLWRRRKCDYPGCKKKVFVSDLCPVAIVKRGRLYVFCCKHSNKLLKREVPLIPLEKVPAKTMARVLDKMRRREHERQIRAEKFICDLKEEEVAK